MGSMCFYVSSVTNAIRGKELLDKNGIRAHISRLADENIKNGCGYCIFVSPLIMRERRVFFAPAGYVYAAPEK